MINCVGKITVVVFHGESERVAWGNHEVTKGMPIAANFTSEARSIFCSYVLFYSKRKVFRPSLRCLSRYDLKREEYGTLLW
jgi:hypothetical protein